MWSPFHSVRGILETYDRQNTARHSNQKINYDSTKLLVSEKAPTNSMSLSSVSEYSDFPPFQVSCGLLFWAI